MNTITIIILVNLGVLIFGTLFYIIWNLMKKNERLEDMNGQQNTYIQNVSALMSESNRKLKEIDSKQIFESDDEEDYSQGFSMDAYPTQSLFGGELLVEFQL